MPPVAELRDVPEGAGSRLASARGDDPEGVVDEPMLGIPKRYPRTTITVIVSVVALGLFGFLWFRPDRLFVSTKVNESAPSSAASALHTLSTGSFRSLEHETTGRAQILSLDGGRRVLRLEDFRTSNGPDVVVLLSDTPSTESGFGRYDDGRFVSLGRLKGTIGDQNYEIGNNVDLSTYRSVVIWCRRFTVAFGAAPLELMR